MHSSGVFNHNLRGSATRAATRIFARGRGVGSRRNQNLGNKTGRGEEPREGPKEGRVRGWVGTLRGNEGGRRGTMTASRLPNPTAKKKKLVGLPHRIATAERGEGRRATGKEEGGEREERRRKPRARRGGGGGATTNFDSPPSLCRNRCLYDRPVARSFL